ncbi:YafY family protein [Actinoplanes sp. N902-109]|uniref:helix-turn-helix transcriptional regulator n=1 Tax=Actinoplanes sp. (strain N902-109) TaxID=649831 RepID=UPI00032959E8|nr:WYL domain-containing protein [Actinoplanes sp. N902-109]AGL17430.1 DeoR family transcriptional regulator [Actinoplanes sp. N902-109]
MPKTSARLLALLSLLQTRRDWSGTVLADRLDISLRTVRRDVDRLRELGYPIAAVKGPDGGYRLGAGTELPPLLFDDDQAVALTIALQTAATTLNSGLAEDAGRALNTIRQVMPSRLRHRLGALDVTAVQLPTTRPAEPVDGAVLLTISAAVRAREILRFDYGDDSTKPPRRVEPHHVVTRAGRWYLIAWDLDRDDWRTFRVDRISLRTPNGPRFTPRALPGADVAAYVNGIFRGSGDAAGNWPCQGTVLLDLPAATVALYTRDGLIEQISPGRCRLTLGSWSWPSLAAAIARYDADIEVVGPDELTEAFAHLARRFTRTAAGHASAQLPPGDGDVHEVSRR